MALLVFIKRYEITDDCCPEAAIPLDEVEPFLTEEGKRFLRRKKCNDGTESATKKCKGALCFVFFVCVYRCTVISATYPESASFALHNQPLLPLPLRFSARMFQFLR